MAIQEHAGEGDNRKDSILQLIRGIFQDFQTLISKEVTGAKLEIKQEINKFVRAGISMGAGGFLLSVGVVLISFMIVHALTTYTTLTLWVSYGIVGLVYCLLGAVMMWAGKRRVNTVKPFPERSVQSAKEDVRHIAQRASGH